MFRSPSRPWIFYHFHPRLSSVGFDKVYRFIHSVLCRVHNATYEAKWKQPSDAPRALLGVFCCGSHWDNSLPSFWARSRKKKQKRRIGCFAPAGAMRASRPRPRDLFCKKGQSKNFYLFCFVKKVNQKTLIFFAMYKCTILFHNTIIIYFPE